MVYPMGGGKKNYKLTGKVGSKKDSKKILKSSIHYVIAVLERAKYRVQKAQQDNLSPLYICLYVIKKIEGFIEYLNTKF